MSEVTRILQSVEAGDPKAADELLPLVYDELRKLAAAKMANEIPEQTLQATALVHEAYLRLVEPELKEGAKSASEHSLDAKSEQRPREWHSRSYFFAAAAEAMRRILVENARRKGRLKRAGDRAGRPIVEGDLIVVPTDDEVLDLDDAVSSLEAEDERGAQIAKLRFFAGMTLDEAAETLGISVRTAKRDWAYARAWISRRLRAYER